MRNLRNLWEMAYSQFWEKFDDCFSYSKTARRAREYVRGLLAVIERKNGWQVAEFIGDASPYAVQNFLSRAIWSADKARDQLILSASQYLLEANERGSLIIDETGFLKKGTHSVGVKRQYSGTAGRIENSQVAVFMALAGSKGHTLIDRQLYLPKEWCENEERRKAVGIPDDVNFKTKQQLAMDMLNRAYALNLSPQWVLADAFYGSSYDFRKFLLDRDQDYVLAVSRQQVITKNLQQVRVDEAVKDFVPQEWKKLSAGVGSKGNRWYEWVSMELCWPASAGKAQFLLARRKIGAPEEIAYYFCHAPKGVTTEELAKAAGQRWQIESCFEEAKQNAGLDEYEVRSWKGWYRHITLSMTGLLLLNIFKGLGKELSDKKKSVSCQIERF